MLVFIIGAFFVLHGLVHLFYFGQSQRLFALQPGMVWPDGSWVFEARFGEQATRWLASAACIVAALAFVAGGIGFIAGWVWWRQLVIGAALFSITAYVLFWDGTMRKLADQGGIALLINVVILAVLFMR